MICAMMTGLCHFNCNVSIMLFGFDLSFGYLRIIKLIVAVKESFVLFKKYFV